MSIVAVPQQDAIEVYVHPDGDAVAIRQQSGMDDPDIVLIAPHNIERVIRALRSAAQKAVRRVQPLGADIAWADAIAELQREHKMSQAQIARACKCGQVTVSDLATGKSKDPRDSLGQALRALLAAKRQKTNGGNDGR